MSSYIVVKVLERFYFTVGDMFKPLNKGVHSIRKHHTVIIVVIVSE